MTMHVLTGPAPLVPRPQPAVAWLRDAKYGIGVHYFPATGSFQSLINAFNVQTFASHCERAGAAYVILTMGQNNGYYLAPNATYDAFAGYTAGQRCSTRDLPLEIAQALRARGIRFVLYLPSRGPMDDAQALTGLADVNNPNAPMSQTACERWQAVIREWALRYGTLLDGWWFDGCFAPVWPSWNNYQQAFNFATWAAAARAGNPACALAFGVGTASAWAIPCPFSDWSGGEQTTLTVLPNGSNFLPHQAQWQVYSWLGTTGWGTGDAPRYSNSTLIQYIRDVNMLNGIVTMDTSTNAGNIEATHLAQLEAVKAALRP
jgi:alpha-L-fucosidase